MKLELFNAKKAAWEQIKKQNQKKKTPLHHSNTHKAFFDHMSKYLKTNGGGQEGFRAAWAAWNGIAAMKRPAAAGSAEEPKVTKKRPAIVD